MSGVEGADLTEEERQRLIELRKARQFKKFTYRGKTVEELMNMSNEEVLDLVKARTRRRMLRGLKRRSQAFIRKLRQAKAECPEGEKPRPIKTHLRNMLIIPEMIGSQLGVYNGKQFALVEVRPEMIGHYTGEFSISYRPVKHGRPGIGSTNSSRFIPLN
uniref:40S ribosomal protein S15 n=1 Tax=Phaeomonas parva TaxID=124430 RepID=A0A6U4HI12_9STRA|mmetsp:Transcript_33867/g.107007  ORF Transcript_33867/g.107007 Transcript_33867/m.107007 type:complete len:160 (+) Transcript_33867:167-646(+)|eukprot:CAMPEP_0118880638 /NCGR_PEP_ID=MMETSP1163-20130328/20195_1 /TAXON_ID=124430 /ORGANISM="Phaeomonas parva, Strain CCMP2877" /LENGTH=159 /DNA_ID=CAMNT_0006817121 /DNA_START=69 /DNA_END=548 /DNA_ORIENTATION=-